MLLSVGASPLPQVKSEEKARRRPLSNDIHFRLPDFSSLIIGPESHASLRYELLLTRWRVEKKFSDHSNYYIDFPNPRPDPTL